MAGSANNLTLRIFTRLSGEKLGLQYTELSKATIRSVAQGVLGVAVIQAILAAIGMYFMDVPAWGLWTLLILVLAVAQLPPILILAPVIVYVFSVADTTPAVIFTIWSVIVSVSDGFLKPLFLGRGMETPMLVILLGAIGGMMLSGIIGLFVGAIVLALSYELFVAWLNQEQQAVAEETFCACPRHKHRQHHRRRNRQNAAGHMAVQIAERKRNRVRGPDPRLQGT